MSVMQVTTMTVQPRGWAQAVEDCKLSKSILEKYGGRNVRILVPIVGGGPSGTMHLVFEGDDVASLGKTLDSVYADPKMVELMTRSAENVTWQGSILVDLPLS